ncbi:hypothetical protein [Thalassotalea sp. PS06]|uniref:hypothetical protein n=1 Tax=Thalassotalea sp. PS06 TaxID=2594005 RepID=UPI001161C802|nr:hypothetical protein [Thalassotalea sp. PS06]QDP01021.1 hypothetical protein FNC98_06475 [Thalassotalea sp. PS06]
MFHQNMTIKLWLVIWLTFIGLYFVLPQSELLDQENFVLPIIENNPDAEFESMSNGAGGIDNREESVTSSESVNSENTEVLTDKDELTDTTVAQVTSNGYIQNANLPYIPDLEVGVTEREQVLNTLGQPARQLQKGKVLEYYFEQQSDTLQVLTEEESNLLLRNEIAPKTDLYHLMIEFDFNNVIMAMNMQPL